MSSRALIRQIALVLACLATATVVLGLYGLALNVDASAFLVIGRAWVAGTPPYSGLWDHKPPGIYILAAIANLIDRHGDGVVALRVLSIGSIVGTALAIDGVVRHLTGRVGAGIASAILITVLVASPLLSLGGGLTELFATTGTSIALLATLKSRSGSRRMAFVAGTSLGWAVSCSLLSVGMIPALAFVWLSDPSTRTGDAPKGLVEWIKPGSLGWFTLGGAVVCAACWAPVILSGALGAGLDAVVGYNALYRSLAIFEPAQWIGWILFFFPFWLPALTTVVVIRRDDNPELTRMALIWIAGSLGWLLWGQRLFPHYLLMLTVPAVLLTVAGALRLRNLTLPHRRRLTSVIYVELVVMGLAGMIWNGPGSPMPEALINRAVADYIDARTAQPDGIYVWGYSPDIYLSADRMPRGRFFHLLPLTTPGFGETAADEMLRTWNSNPPLLIVDASFGTASHGAMAPLLVDHPIATEDRRTDSSALDGLRVFVRDHYEMTVVIGDKRIYRYRG